MSGILDKASDEAFAALVRAGGNLSRLPIVPQTIVVIYSAQGVIDNGGLEFFYEKDFPHKPPYSYFAEAYRRIGADDAAQCIERTADMFPFKDPHLFENKRTEFLTSLQTKPSPEFSECSERICGDESVWQKLEAYVLSHQYH